MNKTNGKIVMDNTNEKPKKKRIGLEIAILLAILATVGYAGYVTYSNIDWNPALIVTIATGVNESRNDAPIITNVTFEQTKVIYKGADSPVTFPDISIMIRNEALTSFPVSYWASASWNQGETEGKYVLTVLFKEKYTPKPGDLLVLTIKQTGMGGYILNKQTAFYEWK